MENGKAPLYLTTLLLGVLAATLLVIQPYTADWPGADYAEPARRYIRAALRQDSIGLDRLSASSDPVIWALNAARAHHDSLALWNNRIQAYTGERRADTAQVIVYPTSLACRRAPIVLRFVGTGKGARVLHASSTCWRP